MSDELSSRMPRLVVNTSGTFNDGPIEEEEVAKQKLKEAGFEEGNFTKEHFFHRSPFPDSCFHYVILTPMVYFCVKGDIGMCRYLVSKGASITEATNSSEVSSEVWKNGPWTLMRAAASCGKLESCRWLHENGVAVYDGQTKFGHTTLGLAIRTYRYRDSDNSDNSDNKIAVAKWIILNYGLARDASGEIDDASMRLNLTPSSSKPGFRELGPYHAMEVRPELLSWAESGIVNHESFMTFLSGTLSIPDFSKESFRKHVSHKLGSETAVQEWVDNSPEHLLRAVWEDMFPKRESPLRCFSGKSGILKSIANFYDLTPAKDSRIFHELAPALRRFIRDRPVSSFKEDDVYAGIRPMFPDGIFLS